MNAPDQSTASKFNELPEETQRFLSRLQGEDIQLLEEGLNLVRASLTIGRMLKWLFLGFLAIVVAVNSLYDQGVKLLAWVHIGK